MYCYPKSPTIVQAISRSSYIRPETGKKVPSRSPHSIVLHPQIGSAAMNQSVVQKPGFDHMIIVEYVLLSTYTVLLMDYLIMFSYEVDLIWKARWTFTKGLYLATRYISLGFIIPVVVAFKRPESAECLPLNTMIIWTTWSAYALSQMIFLLRTRAIWVESRWVMILLPGMYTFSVGSHFAINVNIVCWWFQKPIAYRVGCSAFKTTPTLAYSNMAVLFVYETVLGCLTIVKALSDVKGINVSRAPLLTTLYRDGLMFYVYIAAISLANIIATSIAPNAFFGMIFSLQRVLHSILSVRVMLHIREVRAEEAGGKTEVLTPTFPTIEFEETDDSNAKDEMQPRHGHVYSVV